MCGINHTSLLRLANNWSEEQERPRGQKISNLLASQGYQLDSLHLRTSSAGVETHAYTDHVCMAILEYYAFESPEGTTETALRNYRLLARFSFRSFIYNRCGYDPDKHIPESWKTFHERILLNNQIPSGFFSIFREIADLVVHMIQEGCPLDDHTVPDISVGIAWSKYWEFRKFAEKYGDRTKYPHEFPDWFPQSAVNPVETWIYPASALGEFRVWIQENYIPEKFPKYIKRKVGKGVFLPSRAEMMLKAVSSKPLLEGKN